MGTGLIGRDEIGRVGQAFDQVRQTAIRAAVDEARLRRGLNDVFRSLARRSQSLLHRQLILLDQMERRASDPEALDDLFRLDHLTTRMRRHAEGLVILAGAAPSRAWSSPVRMVDVMRGAIAEVEDYARVSVATRSQAALAGSAVADVIHLLAELVENATTLSPPYTSVRVSGDAVASGFAIEVEDRGLGMSPQRLAELNERLASPPEFNPSDSEQLGLFVVSQLAHRHGIRVTLRASPYGGTSAIVLIPAHLVVTEEAFRAGLPGEQPAAIGAGRDSRPAANGNHLVPGQAGPGQLGPGQRLGARPGSCPGQAGPGQAAPRAGRPAAGQVRRHPRPVGTDRGAAPGGSRNPHLRTAGRPGRPRARRVRRRARGPDGPGAPGFDVFTPMRRGPEAADRAAPQDGGPAPDAPGSRAPAAAPEAGAPGRVVRQCPDLPELPAVPRCGHRALPAPAGAVPRMGCAPGRPLGPADPDDAGGLPSDRDRRRAALGAAWPDRTAAARGGGGRRGERPAAASQAGQPGSPAARQPAGPHFGGRGRLARRAGRRRRNSARPWRRSSAAGRRAGRSR